jgi:hypothetical protein
MDNDLPFRIKRPGEDFFSEGDVSEVATLIEVDDRFVRDCAALIAQVATVINKVYPTLIMAPTLIARMRDRAS